MTGVLIFDKPQDFTSFDAVAVLRRLTGEKKIGHTGTLDPMATGVLPMLLGRATRALPFLKECSKTYEAGFAFGTQTDTLDSTGKVLNEDKVSVSSEKLKSLLPRFTGEIKQVPPMFSALKKDGVRLYDLARQGKTVERKARPVTVYSLELLSYDEEKRTGSLRLVCSGGTYVRTLCDDLGTAAGSHGIMTSLRRTAASGFSLSEAVSLTAAREMSREQLLSRVLPVETLFKSLSELTVTQPQAARFLNGGVLSLERLHPEKPLGSENVRVKDPQGHFLGLGAFNEEKGGLKSVRIFAEN